MPIPLRSITLAALALASGTVAAHDGGVNAEGCHHEGKVYHCHRRGASPPPPVQHFAPGTSDRSPDHASGVPVNRSCTAAILACGAVAETAHGAAPSSAMGETGEQQRGTKQILEAGGSGLLVLAVLFVLALYTIRGVQGHRSQRRN